MVPSVTRPALASRSEAAAAAPLAATVVHVMTVPCSTTFLRGQVGYMRDRGVSVHVITSPGPELDDFVRREGVAVETIEMPRAITPLRDLAAVARLWRALRRLRPDIVHSHTPKGGLLGMIAAWLARTPVRVYHLRGTPFETATGLRRVLLGTTERISCTLAHRVIAVSHSMRRAVVDAGLCPPGKIKVLLGGSGNGVDATERFRPERAEIRAAARALLGIPDDALVVGFVGRLSRDKGIAELAAAWNLLRDSGLPEPLHLLLVGWNEVEPALSGVASALLADPRVHFTGPRSDTPPLYSAMDVVALPTYREGFPNVALEAAAMALPIVATRVTGCVDAVQHGVTGTLVAARDAKALADALRRYLSDPALRAAHGEQARRRVLSEFRREAIWEAIATEYRDLLGRR